jgi:hypothetical protein
MIKMRGVRAKCLDSFFYGPVEAACLNAKKIRDAVQKGGPVRLSSFVVLIFVMAALLAHVAVQPGTRGTAIVDIFRLENGKVVEHWDVHEDLIEDPANPNEMF